MKTALLTVCALTSLIVAIAAYASPAVSVAHADVPNPESMLAQYPAWVLDFLCESNVYSNQNPTPGRTIRFQTPVEINLNGIPQAREATRNIEAMTSGAVAFRIVDADPAVGIVVDTGDALDRNGAPGLGHVTSARAPQSLFAFDVRERGCYSIADVCASRFGALRPYARRISPILDCGTRICARTGTGGAFRRFTGIEGVSLEMLVTLTALYRVPPGTDMSQFCATLR